MGEEQLLNNQGEENTEVAGASTAENEEGAQGEQAQTERQEQEKKYTDADVNRIIAKKIAAERSRMQKLFNDEQQESEIEKRERNVLKRELMADARDELVNQGLPSSLAKVLDYSSKENCESSLKDVIEIFRDAMQQEYARRLGGPVPRAGVGTSGIDSAIKNAFAPNAR